MQRMTLAMMLRILSLSLLVLGGCVSTDDRICLDWRVTTETREKCVPLYGAMICADEQVTRNTCTLYAEDDYGEAARSKDPER